jgi:hypothetical protein
MTKNDRIAMLLNELIAGQPSIAAKLLDSGIAATDAITERTDILCRDCEDGPYITITGILSAIGMICGEDEGDQLRTIWDFQSEQRLQKFVAFKIDAGEANEPH